MLRGQGLGTAEQLRLATGALQHVLQLTTREERWGRDGLLTSRAERESWLATKRQIGHFHSKAVYP
jgi:hypothetical protein